jgi:hypothetical protein
MIYFSLIPYQIAIMSVKLLGYKISLSMQTVLFYYSLNILNWICGYHWTLSMESMQSQTKWGCGLLMILTTWTAYTYAEGQREIAMYILIVLTAFQNYGDFRSDITYAISPHIKFARIMSTISIISFLLCAL